MPLGSALNEVARIWFAQQREKLGINQAERDATAAADESALRRAQAARTLADMETPEERAAKIDYVKAQAEQARAHGEYYTTPKQAKAIERTTDLGDRVLITYTDGSTEERSKGAAPKAPGTGGGSGAAANPFNMTDASTGDTRPVVRGKDGQLHFVTQVDGVNVGAGPTADQRNADTQAQAVEPAFELVQQSLNTLKKVADASTFGTATGLVPGTDVAWAKSHFQDQAKALLGAIVARQAGEGSRLSDEDRVAYSHATAIVNNMLLLPGGIEEAQKRMDEVKALLANIIQRRRGGGVTTMGAAPGGSVPPRTQIQLGNAVSQTKLINGVPYVKVQGGWKRQR